MGFLSELVSEFSHSGKPGQQHGSPQSAGGSHGPPPVSPPWYTEWDGRDNRWLFVNQQTGERTFTYPGPGYGGQQGGYGGPQGGYGQQNHGGYGNPGDYQQGSYNPGNSGYQQQEHEKKQGGNGWKYAAAGAAGVAGGALLMHEGENIKHDYEHDKYRVENRLDEFGNDITNLPENAASWTGEQVGRVEKFNDRVENRFDNAVNDVEDFPEDAARWGGQKVQEFEDIPQDIENKWDNAEDDVAAFGGRIEQSYDDGRDEQRYDDDRRDDDW
ncbi:hypothetical protein BDU57DRAFT_339916 [Ampelomyces quisqualis]|uniref:WW domain-containing protein n=1 Tax=Ampelomyces quisqualis TaxID=50730 RepID=A0A6A5QDQ4_AMPQU|nr:hypothetical protein BDU57DRAFT_339916 [Ampelomyces quisqualis]